LSVLLSGPLRVALVEVLAHHPLALQNHQFDDIGSDLGELHVGKFVEFADIVCVFGVLAELGLGIAWAGNALVFMMTL
jgi:hypothetical protein